MKNNSDAASWFDRVDDVGIRPSDHASHYTRLGKEVYLTSMPRSSAVPQADSIVQILQDFFITTEGIEESDVAIAVFIDDGAQFSTVQARELARSLVVLANEVDGHTAGVAR